MLDPVYLGVECLELEAVLRVVRAVRSTKVTHANMTFRFVGCVESDCSFSTWTVVVCETGSSQVLVCAEGIW